MIVTGASILIIVTGITMLVMAIYFETNPSLWTIEMDETFDMIKNQMRSGVFTVVLIGAILAIGVGIGGALCMCKACANCCAAVAFGIILFFVWIIYLVAGSIITGVSNLGYDAAGTVCHPEEANIVVAPFATAIYGISETVSTTINQYMCGSTCPCDDAAKGPYVAMEETALNALGRTKTGSITSDGYLPFVWTTTADDMTANFVACVDKVNESTGDDNSGWATAAKFQGFFENKYNCSGICSVPLFYAVRPVSDGVPAETCLEGLQTEIQGSSQYIGITSIIIGILMFITWIMQYCLWKKFDN